MQLVAVAAMTRDRLIAKDGEVPWNHPADVAQYKRRVADSPVVLGRTTFEDMYPEPPGSRQIVLSRSLDGHESPTVTVVGDVEAALEAAAATGADRVYVLGGGQVYDAFLPHYDEMVLTVVADVVDADGDVTVFPDWDRDEWRRTRVDDAAEGFRIEFWARARTDAEAEADADEE